MEKYIQFWANALRENDFWRNFYINGLGSSERLEARTNNINKYIIKRLTIACNNLENE